MALMHRSLLVAAFVAALSLPILACASTTPSATGPAAEFFTSPDPAVRTLPFSEAVRAGNILFVSGQIGNAPGTLDLVPGGITAESKQAMENIRAILERHGSSLDHVVKCTAFLADIREWPAFNEIYKLYFAAHFPSRSALGVSGLARGARVEIECTAFVPALLK